ncbi:MAG: nucleotidyltransferase family protein [Gemmatimonadota bacterium]
MPEIRDRFEVRDLWVFGSVAKDTAVDGSDLDVLVDFEGPATFDGFMELKFFLEDLLEMEIDLVTRNGLRERLRPSIEREAIRVA